MLSVFCARKNEEAPKGFSNARFVPDRVGVGNNIGLGRLGVGTGRVVLVFGHFYPTRTPQVLKLVSETRLNGVIDCTRRVSGIAEQGG
jgi:hypothetical protein